MKPEKVFVRYKNLNQPPPYNKERNEKRPYDKKRYTQKSACPRQALKTIYDSFSPITEIPALIQKLLTTYPKFFNREGKAPQKENTESLNEFLILNRNKFMDVLREPKKQVQQQSSSDPDWNSDEDFDCNTLSKKIDETIVEKVVEKLGDRQVKKIQKLKPHEKRFLEEYFKQKRNQEQQASTEVQSQNKNLQSQTLKINEKEKKLSSEALREKPKNNQYQEKAKQNIWSQYQQRQVNTFVDLGFMTKVEDNQQEEITAQIAEDDDMFKDDFDQQCEHKSASQSSDQSHQEDDIFGDQHPTTTIKTKQEAKTTKVQTEMKITQGTVVINDHIFSKIAEKIGLLPVRCNWIIKNDLQKFKVSTEYMDAYYRKQKMYEIFPMISLNHSDFISNEKVETAQGLQVLRDYNYRLKHHNGYHYNQHRNNKYQERHFTHLKKK